MRFEWKGKLGLAENQIKLMSPAYLIKIRFGVKRKFISSDPIPVIVCNLLNTLKI